MACAPPSWAPARTSLRAGAGLIALSLAAGLGPAGAPPSARAAVHAAPPASLSSPASPSPTATADAAESQPTDAQVQAAQQRAARLHQEVTTQTATVAQARAALSAAAARAGLALERYRSAVLAEQQAQRAAWHQQDLLRDAQARLEVHRADLGQWAREAYSDGTTLVSHPVAATLLSGGSTDDLDLTVMVLHRVGRSWRLALSQVEATRQEQDAATTRAQEAADRATRAAADAIRARAAADAAVRVQQSTVEDLQTRLAGTVDAAAEADQKAALLAQAKALAARRQAARTGNAVTGPVGDCAGGDVSGYPNGTIPLSVLCPLWGAPGEYLRADAAYAFNRLSQAYATRYGTPLCVTDSYRAYADQVRVRAESPGLAAVPGTSNHGWGTAVDLCGGIERFGTSTHAWMLLNAPLFGWFHPAWAEPAGSMPEPWHWEFGG